VQNISFYNLPPKKGKINVYATVILTLVVCGYETWSLTLWVFENLVLTMVLGLRGWKV